MSVSGVLIVDKPAGMTSHDVVQRVRRRLNTKKVGHAGTLDPEVTGVLVLCVGTATKLIEYAMAESKGYAGTICFGTSTDTDDATGTVLHRTSAAHLTEEIVRRTGAAFVGEIEQTVPRYSAVHVEGKRAYEYAREGIEIDLPTRNVSISELVISSFTPGELAYAEFHVNCSKGTYIRALCRDWGVKAGIPAHMTRLRRTRSGPFTADEAVDLRTFEESSNPAEWLQPAAIALRSLPSIRVSESQALRLSQGQVVQVDKTNSAQTSEVPHAVFTANGELVGIATFSPSSEPHGIIKPRKVFWKRV